MNKHTPGPWTFMPADNIHVANWGRSSHWVSGPFTDESEYRTICDLARWDTQDRQIANAKLIAAAPDLLEALIGALDHWPVPSSICKDRPAYEAACAAVLKATGEQS